jgi:hypothetical protein
MKSTALFRITHNKLTFSPGEEKSFNLLMRLKFKEELKIEAVNLLSSSFRHSALQKKAAPESAIRKAFKYLR